MSTAPSVLCFEIKSFLSISEDISTKKTNGVPMQDEESQIRITMGSHGKRIYLGGHFPGVYLTLREAQIVQLLEKYKYREVAAKLNISRRTVEFYTMNMKKKMHCITKQQLLDKLQRTSVMKQLKNSVNIRHLLEADLA